MIKRKGRELPADKHENVPINAKWLTGQGEGTWFTVTKEDGLSEYQYRVRRTTPQGKLDCDRVFELIDPSKNIDLSMEWDIVHVSHCAIVRVKQNGIIHQLNFVKEF